MFVIVVANERFKILITEAPYMRSAYIVSNLSQITKK